MFMRVGGGIFTKAADVGADLVGKIEQGIPEDDPRNAATIADNVGDNVGDCAGMAADLFESYEVTLVAALILGAAAFADSEIGAIAGVMFPLFVRAVGVVTSIVGIMAVTPRSEDEHGMKAINRGFFLSAVISAVLVIAISVVYMESWRPGVAVAIGLVLASVIQILTQYFTDTKFKPVKEVADSTVTGPATTVLSGFSVGLESAVWATLVIAGRDHGRVPARRPRTPRTCSPSVSTSSRSPAWACSPRSGWSSRWTPTARSATTLRASPRCRASSRAVRPRSSAGSTPWATRPRPSRRAWRSRRR